MKLIYLKEGRNYTSEDLENCIKGQVEAECQNGVDMPPDFSWLSSEFLEGLRDSINAEFKKTVVKGTKGSKFVFHYLGLYDYVDNNSGKNLTFFFVPKFIDFQDGTDCNYDEDHEDENADKESAQSDSWNDRIKQFDEGERNAVLLAIDRYNKEQNLLAEQMQVSEKKRASLLELAVRVLRDYLENGLYIVQRRELEHNGQGEIDWNTTIDQFQPVIVRGRPYYMDVMTEQAYSDEEHYITRLHKCLVTVWGSKLEKLGLSSVLRVNVPPLSEEELDHFGDAEYQIAQINRELNVQFVTKSRETLKLMKELILRSTENQASSHESLSFGMTGVEHLWETACAEVLGTELEKKIRDCGFVDGPEGVTFSKYMPRVFWKNLVPAEDGNSDSKEFNLDKGSQRSKKAGWRLDFIRTYRPNGRVEKLVILDSKYYCARWNKGSISGQPGTPDIAKQMFYQMTFEDLIQEKKEKKIGIVNAFLLPEDDKNPRYNLGKDVKISETVVLKSRQKGSDGFERARAFKGINLFAVRIPGIRLLDRYANWEIADDWFEKIVNEAPKGEEENSGETNAPDAPGGAEKKDDVTEAPKVSASAENNQVIEKQDTSEGGLSDDNQAVPPESTVDVTGDASRNTGGPVLPIENGCISKEFIRDVMSIPSYSGREEMMKEYITRFANDRSIDVHFDAKGNLYLTKGKPTNEEGHYPCLVNHMDTVQDKHLPYIERKERLAILERPKGPDQTEFYVNGMGIGADDKSGCAIALALIDQLQVVKAAFFVEEEREMVGSKQLDRGWFNDVGFCLSFDSPGRNRSSRKCGREQLYSDSFFKSILKPICDVHGITEFRDEPDTDIVQIRQKIHIMCYNVGNGGYNAHNHDEYLNAHNPNEYLIVEDAQAAYKFGFDLLNAIGEDRYWFDNKNSGDPGGGDPPKRPDQPVLSVAEVFEGAGDSNPVSSATPDVCNCRMEADTSKTKTEESGSLMKSGNLESGNTVDVTADTARTQTKEQQIMPGLKIYHGSRIEDLAEKLVAELKGERKDPFEFLKVAVANPNLDNWLKMKVLAKVPELSAGIKMPFLDDRLAELLKANYRGALELISGRDYPVVIIDALMNHWRDDFLPFLKYIKDSKKDDQSVAGPLTIETQREARKAVQLVDKLAQLIDAYEATGYLGLPEENKDKNEVYRGEQALVETLFGKEDTKGLLEEKGKISLRQMFDEVKKDEPKDGAERILLFGQVELTDIQIDILTWLAQKREILWYFPEDVEQSCGVASWAAAKKKTIAAVKEKLGVHVSFESVTAKEPDREKPSVLCALQSGETVPELKQDASVQVVGAPGIRREVEMVYNAILGAVWEKNDNGKPVSKKGMSFSDIAVLVPDMPTYRPMIEAVFDGRGQIPYGLVDATTQDYSTYLDGFLALMDIARYGLSRKRIFIALENPCVQRAMGFTRDDVVKWRELAEDFGAYEGYKEADSDEKNVSGYFNWEWALRRMRLGLVAQDVGVEKGGADKLPLEARDADVVYKFSEVVETLYRKLSALSRMPKADCSSKDEKEWPDTWAGRLHAVMDEFLAVDRDDDLEPLVRARIVKTLNGLTMIKGPQSFKLPVAMVEHCVAGTECAKGGYLRHGVTIGGLRSLAHVPFKQIFVLGLGEGGLPGRNDCSTLDVRNELKVEERGDVLRPEESRARFLAAVLSARDRLVLSYPNRELGSDAKLYPSSVVNDLKSALSQVISCDFKEFKGYPLTEFAEPIQTPDGQVRSAISGEQEEDCFKGLLPSLSKKAYALAGYAVADVKKIEDKGADKEEAAKAEEAPKTDTAEKNELAEPTPKDLAEFVKDPFTAILKKRLGIAVEGYRDKTLEEASPLGVPKGPTLWDLQKEIVLKHFEPVFDRKQVESYIPTEFLGDFAKEKLSKIVSFWGRTEFVSDLDRAILESGQSTDSLSVVCKPFTEGTEDEPISLPPDAVLLPLFEFLKKQKEGDVKTTNTDQTKYEFKVKVLDVANGGVHRNGLPKGIGCWKYTLDFSDTAVAGYYNAVVAEYKRFAVAWDDGGEYPSVTYDELREQLKTLAKLSSVNWDLTAREIVRKRNESQPHGSSFNSNLVVSRVADVFKRDPSGSDVERFFKKLFWLPMSVENELSAINGGAR